MRDVDGVGTAVEGIDLRQLHTVLHRLQSNRQLGLAHLEFLLARRQAEPGLVVGCIDALHQHAGLREVTVFPQKDEVLVLVQRVLVLRKFHVAQVGAFRGDVGHHHVRLDTHLGAGGGGHRSRYTWYGAGNGWRRAW